MRLFTTSETGFLDEEISKKFSDYRREIEKKIQSELLDKNDYGNALIQLSIIPSIFPQWFYDKNPGHKERKLYSAKKKNTDMRLRIDYESFIKADDQEKKRLIIKNIIDSIRILKKKIKNGFYADRLENDIQELFNLKGKI